MRYRGGSGDRARLLARWSVAVTGALVMASCGPQGAMFSSAAPSPPPPAWIAPPTWTAPPASSPADVATKAAVAAYVATWQAMARAGETSDWQSPELGPYATGEALATIVRSLYADQLDKVVTRGAPTNSPVVRSAEPPEAPAKVVIEDCGDSTSWLKYHQGTDRPAGTGSGGGRRFVTAEVLRQLDGAWLVSRFAVQGLSTC
jgi:hypothetical protein